MALKPLSLPQKRVLRALARAMAASELSKVEGMEGFKKHLAKIDPESAQAERFLIKAFKKECKTVSEGLKQDGS